MPLHADIHTMSVPDFLQWISTSKKSGISVFQKKDRLKELVFDAGSLIWVTSNDPREYLGQLALRQALITEQQLTKTLEKQRKQPKKASLGQLLIEQKLLTEEQLQELLNEQFINIIYDIFLWDSGQFHFAEENINKYKELSRWAAEVNHLVFEGARRWDEWNRLKEYFPNDEIRIQFTQEAPTEFDEPFAIKVAKQIKQHKTLGEIILELRVHGYYVLQTLQQWREQGWLTIKEGQTAVAKEKVTGKPVSQETVQLDRELLNQVSTLAKSKRLDEALDLLSGLENPALARLVSFLRVDLETQYNKHFYSHFPKESVPQLSMAEGQILRDPDIDSKAYFILSRITGNVDTATIVMASPLGEINTLRTLKLLHDKGYIRFKGAP